MLCRLVSRDREHNEHRVLRTDKDITALYTGMLDKFLSRGCVVPPPPTRKGQLMARYARLNKVGAVRGDDTGEFVLLPTLYIVYLGAITRTGTIEILS